MRSYLFAAVALALLLSICTAAWSQEAGEIPYSANIVGVSTNPPTSNIWTYTIYNTSSSADYGICQVGIELDKDIDLNRATIKSITVPKGWGCFKDDPYVITVFTTTPLDLAAGAFQGGFIVEFDRMPQKQEWSVTFNNMQTGEAPYDQGIVSAAAVPEPGSIISLFAGLTSLAAFAKRRRS